MGRAGFRDRREEVVERQGARPPALEHPLRSTDGAQREDRARTGAMHEFQSLVFSLEEDQMLSRRPTLAEGSDRNARASRRIFENVRQQLRGSRGRVLLLRMVSLHDARLELGKRREGRGCGGNRAPERGDADGEIRRMKKGNLLFPSLPYRLSNVPTRGAGEHGDFL